MGKKARKKEQQQQRVANNPKRVRKSGNNYFKGPKNNGSSVTATSLSSTTTSSNNHQSDNYRPTTQETYEVDVVLIYDPYHPYHMMVGSNHEIVDKFLAERGIIRGVRGYEYRGSFLYGKRRGYVILRGRENQGLREFTKKIGGLNGRQIFVQPDISEMVDKEISGLDRVPVFTFLHQRLNDYIDEQLKARGLELRGESPPQTTPY